MKETGQYFPEFFRELTQVGEQTGHLPEVFRQLAEHYEHQLKLRRVLLTAITWPVIELLLALGVVGLLIWLMGAIPTLQKNKIDILGFGLTGNSGLLVYVGFLAAVAAVCFLLFRATMRGVLWVAPIQRAVMSIPKLGGTIETLAMARLAWALHVTLNSGMETRRALKMSLESTHNVVYTQHIDRVLNAIRQGHSIHEAFAAAGVFPIDFLDIVQVGEESGQLVESMAHLSNQYQDQARLAMNTLTVLLGLAVTALIGGVIIFLIFRVFGFYTNTLNDALKMKR